MSYENGDEYACFIEDDLIINTSNNILNNIITNIPDNMDITKIAYDTTINGADKTYYLLNKQNVFFNNIVPLNENIFCNFSFFLLSKKAMKKYIDIQNDELYPSDIVLWHDYCDLNFYILDSPMVKAIYKLNKNSSIE